MVVVVVNVVVVADIVALFNISSFIFVTTLCLIWLLLHPCIRLLLMLSIPGCDVLDFIFGNIFVTFLFMRLVVAMCVCESALLAVVAVEVVL